MAGWTSAPTQGGITVTEAADATVAHLWGEIDAAMREQAGTVVAQALGRALPVVLDTRQVRFMDSAGVAFLISVCTLARDVGLSVSLDDPPQVVTDVLGLLGLTELFGGPTTPVPPSS